MNDKEQPATRKESEEKVEAPAPDDGTERQSKQTPPEPRKRGPSIDIAPCIGPGTDVVVTPPKHI